MMNLNGRPLVPIKVTRLPSGGVKLTPDTCCTANHTYSGTCKADPKHFALVPSWPCTEVELSRTFGGEYRLTFEAACWAALDLATGGARWRDE